MNKRGGFKKGRPDLTDADYIAKIRARCAVTSAGCWEWQGFKHWNGYGETCYRGKNCRVHRVMLELHTRPMEAHELACHTCHNKSCCNPEHLYIGDKRTNAKDKVESGTNHYRTKTHCPRGHAYAEWGWEHKARDGRLGWRSCKLCARIRNRRRAGWSEEELMLPPFPPRASTARRFSKLTGVQQSGEKP